MTAAAMDVRMTMPDTTTLFLCGDVMLGRGIDQILPHPGNPRLYESYAKSAATYVELAERLNGPIPKPVDYEYVWGDSKPPSPEAAPPNRRASITR
jgi:poly-gamma-glutamate capsule biosynthesis protein CapA/YwtB (metallophosphatase superfamily)